MSVYCVYVRNGVLCECASDLVMAGRLDIIDGFVSGFFCSLSLAGPYTY